VPISGCNPETLSGKETALGLRQVSEQSGSKKGNVPLFVETRLSGAA